MNKVFKVIWNHATQTWVAVSEFSKAKGKTKSKTLTTISLAVGSVLVGSQASAAVYVNNQEVTKHGTKTAIVIATEKSNDVASMINATTNSMDNFIRIGQAGAPVVRDGSIVIGFQINDQSTGVAGDTVIGNYAQIGGGGADSLSTSVGYHTQVAGPSVAMGVGARSDILDSSGWLAVHNGGVAIGSFALQGGNRNGGTVVGGLATGDYHFSTTIGAQAGAIGLIDNRAINKHHGFAVNEAGDPAPINGRIGMTSIGYQAAARGTGATAIGQGATTGITGTTNGIAATALGYHARAFKNNSLALGRDAIAGGLTTDELTALDAELTKLNGLLATAEQEKTAATDALRANPTAENKFAVASAEAAKKRIELAISRATEDKKYAANASANTEAAIAIGYSAKANHANTMAIGRATAAYASGSLALGRAAGVTGVNASTSMAIGDAALISGDSAVDSIAVGHSANIKQNSSNAIAIGKSASVVGDINGSSGSIAIGHNTAAGNIKASWGKNSTRELGYLAAQNATAVGTDSIAGGNNATAFGYKNVINAPNSGALGFNNTVGNYSNPTYNNNVASANYNGTDSFVVGANNNVTANNTVVFGNNVTVNSQGTNRTGAVVLGDNSTVPTDVKAVNSAKIGKENGKKLVYSGFAGNLGGAETNGEPQKAAADKQGRFVSVGNETSPRQVKFVAAGEISSTSTDAINGSQLYAFSGVVNNLATSAATIIGGGATLNQNGTLENFSQPLNTTGLAGAAYTKPTTAANNIATAITNLNNYVNAGWKIAQGDEPAAKARISPNEQVNFKADGLATVSVAENTTNNGADVTYSVKKGTFDTTTNGTVKANSTEGVVTNANVATAVNNSGWNTTLSTGKTLNVNPGDQVNYVNGNGTTANVTTTTVGGKDVVSVSYNVNETTGTVNPNGTVKVSDNNAFLNASAVANLVNNAGFNVTTAKVDEFVTNQAGKANATVKAGGNITYTAGKNIAIKQAGTNFTFATEQNVTFTNANVTSTLALGNSTAGSSSPVVNLKTENATAADVNKAALTSALNITSADGKPTQIKGVGSSLNTTTVTTAPKGTGSTGSETLLNLTNLPESTLNSVVTARDLTNLGWVVSASGNSYKDTVTNAKEVKFNGVNGVSVTGNTTDGVRNINISLNTTTLTSNANGTTTVTNGNSYVNGTTVADAINKAGWNTTLSTGKTLNVNPGDQVNYVNGNGTTANVTTTTVGGKDVVSVSYNVNETTGTVNPNGTVKVSDNNAFLNASAVANLVNNAGFNVTTAKVDEFVTNQAGKANATVKAGGNITYTAGKNIAISQNGSNFTFSTTKDIEVDSVTANKRVQIGSGNTAVNLTSDSGALQVADKDGNATQITNVEAGTNVMAFNKEGDQLVQVGDKFYVVDPETNEVDFTKESTPATEEELDELAKAKPALKAYVAYSKAASGLADLDNSEQTNALTVADAQRLGWVVSASGNDYADSVTNANEVRFNGVNGVSVTGNTTDGVRNINISLNTTTLTSNANGTTTVTNGNSYVNGTTVADAINKAGWNTTLSTGKTLNVNPGDQVNYVNGNGTTANVTTTTVGGKDVVSVSYNVNETTGTVNPNGTVKVSDNNAFLNASAVANLVNNAGFNVTTAKVDEFVTNQAGKANATVKAGGNITYTAGKNIAISQNGSNFTFSTTKDIEVDSVTANKRVQIGSGDTAVNLTTDLGALKVADKDGNATQITNVDAGAETMAFNKEGEQLVKVGDKYYVVDPETGESDFTTEGTPATEEELDKLAKAKPELKAYVAYAKAASGLADLDNSEQTNALTVADAQRLGWVVSASGNDYADSVTNANEVRFNGSNGISVTGETDEHGVRNINVSIAKGNVAGNTTTGVATGDTNYVTGDQVANAINNSGWKTTATKVVDEAGNEIVDANKATAVNPGDSVNYVDGNSTKANVVVTKAADGKETVNVSYDLVTEDHLTPVANDAKSVTKPTNIDAKGKDAATVNDVLNAGWNLQANDEAVDAVTHGNNVNFTSKDGSVKITATSNGSTSSLDFAVNATSIVNQVAGTISYNKDGKATTNGDGKRIATVGDVANTINNTGWLTNVTDAKGNVTTKVVTPNTQVNYVNGDGTKANVVANSTTGGLDVTFNVKSANPETLTVDGNGVKVNTGSITEATDVAGDANRGKVTVATGEGNKVATVQNVANAINSASWTVKVADTQEEITTSTANDEGSSVRAGNEITHVAGKNLKVKRDGRNVTYALANDVSVNTVTAQNSITVGAGNAATTVTTSSAQDGVTEVKLADAAGKATRITNVAAGVKDTDAVNVSQLRNSNAQINQNIAHLNNKVNRMGKDLRAGIAGSNAAAGLPQVYIPGKSMVAAAAGTFKGQSAVAVGYSRASDNGKVILKLQGNANTRGDVGGSVGVGYQW